MALILIIAGVLVWIVLPLTRNVAMEVEDDAEERGELEARRRELLFALQDLDFELQTGKLSAEDHAELRARLQAEAASILARLDSGDRSADAAAG